MEGEKPYIDEKLNNWSFLRTFDHNVISEELVWHRDRATRVITIIEGEGWLLQLDNQLPVEMKVGDMFNIPAYTYHRIKRGISDLKIMIQEI